MTRARRRPSRYVYRSQRIGDTVRREYVGRLVDPVVRALLDAQNLDAADREAVQHAADFAIAYYARFEPLIRFVATHVNRLLRQHRELHRQIRLGLKKERPVTASQRRTATIDTTRDDFDEAVDLAAEGSEGALADLRRMLLRNPQAAAVLGDVAGYVREHLIELLGVHSVAVREAVRRQMEVLERDLLASGNSPLEKLLVDQVVASMLDTALRQLELERDGIGATRRRRFERALDRAQQRHLRAVTALHELRSER